jgi:hypothetical protein
MNKSLDEDDDAPDSTIKFIDKDDNSTSTVVKIKAYRSLRITHEGYEYEGIVNMSLYPNTGNVMTTTGYDPTSTKRRQIRQRQLQKGIIGKDNRTKIVDTTLYIHIVLLVIWVILNVMDVVQVPSYLKMLY